MTDIIRPKELRYRAVHSGGVYRELVDIYAHRLPNATTFSVTGMTDEQPWSAQALKKQLAKTSEISAITIKDDNGGRLTIMSKTSGEFEVLFERGSRGISIEWLTTLMNVIRDAPTFPGLREAAVDRRQSSMSTFVPEPPIARARHAVLTTDGDVAAAYDDPAVFWRQWQTVDAVGPWKLCARPFDKFEIDERSWLARTFEGTMALVRAAKPGLTTYGTECWEPEMASIWEFGDYDDEKGGNPALAPGDYDASTRTYDLIGFVTKTPMEEGGPEPRHVLIREIHSVRDLVRSKLTPSGQPIDMVRILFVEEWMAKQEKRPLLDAGARVFVGVNELTE